MWYWLAAIPVVIELLWLATYVPKLRRWRTARTEISQSQGVKLGPDDFDLAYMMVATLLAREGRFTGQNDRDVRWGLWYMIYHNPAAMLLRVVTGPVPSPLMGSGKLTALTMVVTAAVYSAVCLLVAGLIAELGQ